MKILIDVNGNSTSTYTCPKRSVVVNGKEYGPKELVEELTRVVSDNNLQDKVEIVQTGCLWGCTYGPRLDVEVDGNVVLYGCADYSGVISSRGEVKIIGMDGLDSISNIIYDNLNTY